MTDRSKVTVRIRRGRAVWINGEYAPPGSEVKVPRADAEALIAQRVAEKPDEPLDPEQVIEAEQQRAEDESLLHRRDVALRMERGREVAKANAEQQIEDELARQRNAYDKHLADVRAQVPPVAH